MENVKVTKKAKRLRSNLSLNIIGAIVFLLIISSLITSAFGLASFTESFKKEYSTTTYHMADSAATLVEGDHLDEYLAGEETVEYLRTRKFLNNYCRRMNVSLVYVIMVDTSDYGHFVSVFNSVNNSVDDTTYVEWPRGFERETTNDEYKQKYKNIYENGSAYETIYRTSGLGSGVHPHITTMVPIKNSSRGVSGILCIQRPIRELEDARRPFLKEIALSAGLLAVFASIIAAIYIRRQFVNPITRLSEEAARFAKENTRGEPLGNISRLSEIANLADSIDTMEEDMVNYIDNLTAITAEKERIGAELSLASNIQENSIPNEFPAFPDRAEFDIYASMDPAKQVGGDFYNFFLIDEDHLVMVVGDVSGKGIPAALFMMVVNIMITDRTWMGGTPAEILSYVNQTICERNKADMFVTIWLGILELSTGKLTAVNAGHEYPAVRHGNGQFEIFKDKHGFVVGGMEGIRYKDYEMTLEPGSKLFIYTDGVPEAETADKEMFGTDRMIQALNQDAGATPQQILANVRKSVDEFVKDAEQFDDLTMLCLEYRGMSPERI